MGHLDEEMMAEVNRAITVSFGLTPDGTGRSPRVYTAGASVAAKETGISATAKGNETVG